MTTMVGTEAGCSKTGALTPPPRLPLPPQLFLSMLYTWLLPMHCQWWSPKLSTRRRKRQG